MSSIRDPRIVKAETALLAATEILIKTDDTVEPINDKLHTAHDTINQLMKAELAIMDEAINSHKEMKQLEAAATTLENLQRMSAIASRYQALTAAQTKRFTAARPKLNLPRVPSYTEVFGPTLAEVEAHKAAARRALQHEETMNLLVQPIDHFIALTKKRLEVTLVEFKQQTLDYRNRLVQLGKDNLGEGIKLNDAVLRKSAELRKIGATPPSMPALSEKEQEAVAAEVFAKAAPHSPSEEKTPAVVKKPSIVLPTLDKLVPDVTSVQRRDSVSSSSSDTEERKTHSGGSSPGSSPDHSPPGSPVRSPSLLPPPVVYIPAPHAQLFGGAGMSVAKAGASQESRPSVAPAAASCRA